MNPYHGVDFIHFFSLFFTRMFSWKTLASDEIQIFVLCFIAIASSLVGTLLILRKMTMLANSLSHTILLGIVGAYLLFFKGGLGASISVPILIVAALISGIITTFLTQILHRVMKLQEDASIGIVFTSLFALGILLITLFTRNAHIGLEVVMGNADALHLNDLKIAFGVACANLFIVGLFFKEWKLICFDQGLAASMGVRPGWFHYLLMLLTSATAISAFRAIGVLLFLALLVGPPLTARLLTNDLRKLLFLASVIGILSSCLAVATARHLLTIFHLPLSTAGLVIVFIGIFFALAVAFQRLTFSRYSG